MSFFAARLRPLVQTIPRTSAAIWTRGIHSSTPFRFSSHQDTNPTTSPQETTVLKAAPEDTAEAEEPSEEEIHARAYDFLWSFLGFLPQSIQHMICKSACERMLRSNTSPEYFPDQFLQGAGLAIHQMLPLLSTNIDREPLRHMMTQELYDKFESELQVQEKIKSDVSVKLAAVHDGMVKDVWVSLGPMLKSSTPRGFIRWRWQTLTVALRAATDQISSRDQVIKMMMEGVQFKVDVEFDASIDYTIRSNVLNSDMISDFTRRPLLVRFETPSFEPAEQMVASRSMSRPDEAPIDWNWRVSDIDYLLEQDFIERRKKTDIQDEEHAQREMEM
ncbi:hypothetical protein BG011_002302 [Mortierella polycephala]|uniref:Tim44-like domain-containing protein n=1 Tax=Mortierella polycephala TaxID=41804 RepID=A0A9P6U482_9FUNG|nr:hypothetical protein BG011_002302 [Mortierella polycephala]